jgi:hypothetical protein
LPEAIATLVARFADREHLSVFSTLPEEGTLARRTLALLAFAALTAAAAGAQNSPTTYWSIWAGYSPASPHLIGVTNDRKTFVANFEYSRQVWTNDRFDFRYTAEATPVVTVTMPATLTKSPHTAYGAGAFPVGFEGGYVRPRAVHPFVLINGGVVYFPFEQVPVEGSSHFNFMFSFGGGLHLLASRPRPITVGFRFLHISNAQSGHFNPGVDAAMIWAGITLKKSH